jgi:hypothetical protein
MKTLYAIENQDIKSKNITLLGKDKKYCDITALKNNGPNRQQSEEDDGKQ